MLTLKYNSVGDVYLHLERSAKDGDYVPAIGDLLVQMGNTSDASRQSFVMLSSVNSEVGLFTYNNVNSFSLVGKKGSWFGYNNGIAGKEIIVNGKTIQSYTAEELMS